MDQSLTFGELLRRFRFASGMTQEALAERAGISVRGLSDLERGLKRAPRRETLRLLEEALQSSAPARAALEEAALGARARRPRGSQPTAAPASRIPGEPDDVSSTREPAPGYRHNLPAPLTRLIGREREITGVLARMRSSRLVTLTGTGGVGKTRLALEVADVALSVYPDGVWLVELAAVTDSALVAQTVAGSLGVRRWQDAPVLESVIDYLRPRRLLLLLDNCEHLVAACVAVVGTLLRTCPSLRVLATSREALNIAGEAVFPVPLLAVPDTQQHLLAEQARGYAAVALFEERAQAHWPQFTLTARTAAIVAQIVLRLDGLPLALELAAARVGTLAIDEIAARLSDRFDLLVGNSRSASPRHQTLRATLDWSYDLLDPQEQRLFRQLAVFAGSWTLAAAEAVCADPAATSVVDALGGLVHKSLVVFEEHEERPHYRLLETVRRYAWKCLAATNDATAVQDAHLEWYLALAEQARQALAGPDQGAWLARLESEHDNLRAALGWCTAGSGASEAGLRLATALARFWEMRGYLGEGRRWLQAALASGTAASSTTHARALRAAGALAYRQSDYAGATAMLQQSIAGAQEAQDTETVAAALNVLGNVSYAQNAYDQAATLYGEALGAYRELGSHAGMAQVLNNMGSVADDQGDYAQAARLYTESLALLREAGDQRGAASVLNNLGNVRWACGDMREATALHEQSLSLKRALGDKQGMASSLFNLGNLAQDQGEFAHSAVLYQESLVLAHDLHDQETIAELLEGFGRLAANQGQPARAAKLLGASASLLARLGKSRAPAERGIYDRLVVLVQTAIGTPGYALAWSEGWAMELEASIAFASVREDESA